jgi:hypothetical protein
LEFSHLGPESLDAPSQPRNRIVVVWSVRCLSEALLDIVHAVLHTDVVNAEFSCEVLQLFLELSGEEETDRGLLKASSKLGAFPSKDGKVRAVA